MCLQGSIFHSILSIYTKNNTKNKKNTGVTTNNDQTLSKKNNQITQKSHNPHQNKAKIDKPQLPKHDKMIKKVDTRTHKAEKREKNLTRSGKRNGE